MSPLAYLPYRWIHFLGRRLGSFIYYFGPRKIVKITYNNLALAHKVLPLTEKEMKKVAKESFQNLIINALEYFRLKRSRYKISDFVEGKNLEPFRKLAIEKRGAIAVTGHIANWELCFLEHTQNHNGIAIGKQIKNQKLYDFILSIRTMHGGDIIDMKNALTLGVAALKEGKIFSMVNDQSYTSSSYSYPFFGVRAWTSAAPALMAYKANVPITIVTTTRLPKGKYLYEISDPIWPNMDNPLKKEVKHLMDQVMAGLEKHIAKHPGQWLWQHKRWKQEGYFWIQKKYKGDVLLFILPQDPTLFEYFNQSIDIITKIYTKSFIIFMVPKAYKDQFNTLDCETIFYENPKDIFIRDYRFHLIYDFTNNPKIRTHFLKLGAHKYFDFNHILNKMGLTKIDDRSFAMLFSRAICLGDAPFEELKII